ncbi:unnamed protein product [Urochloa decumbens]|uniref:BED-type domain-containing protein n=1 Tax=Urochloa decumbens TaxID=240449 RepID=A0ABC9FS99_9POAL
MLTGMEVVGNANNVIDEQEESSESVLSPLFLGTKLNKRFRSKVWDYFIPTFVDGKVTMAECMQCHQVYKCGTSGTSSLLRHQANCILRTQKRPRLHQEHTSLPPAHKSTALAGSDPKQKKLFYEYNQKKCPATADAAPERKELALPDTCTETNRKNQEVGQNGSHELLVVPKQKNLALPGISTDNNKSHGKIVSPERNNITTGTNRKNQEVNQNCSPKELIEMLAMHGHLPRMVEQDGFRKLVAWLNPMVTMPSRFELMGNKWKLHDQEQSRLMESLKALRSRVCLSAYICHYDPCLAFLCLRVHYIDDEWEKRQKIIRFSPVNPSCNANELSDIIIRSIGQWGLCGKIFSIILDDAFTDDSVASNVKTRLQKWNKVAADQSLFVIRYATHLLDRVTQVGLDEIDKFMEKSAKCSKYAMGLTPSVVQYPNCRYAPSSEEWTTAEKICEILERFHRHMDSMHNSPSPVNFYDTLWEVKREIRREANFYRQAGFAYKDEGFSNALKKMHQKFKEHWKVCFFHFCMPMVMDPRYRLERIKSSVLLICRESYRHLDTEIDDYIHFVHDTLLSLFYEYSRLVVDANSTSGSKTSKESAVNGDMLEEYYHETEYPFGQRPLTELDQYLQEPCLPTGDSSVLQWWKEHCLTYPTISRMARDILALPCSTDCKVAATTARLVMSESGNEHRVEQLVCIQDWFAPAGRFGAKTTYILKWREY